MLLIPDPLGIVIGIVSIVCLRYLWNNIDALSDGNIGSDNA